MGKFKAGGRELKARLTGGSLRRFKQETGYDFLQRADKADTDDIMLLAFCSLDDREAWLSYEKFCDTLSIPEINGLGVWLSAELRGEEEEREEESEGGAKKKD